jgi:hypothetical protein
MRGRVEDSDAGRGLSIDISANINQTTLNGQALWALIQDGVSISTPLAQTQRLQYASSRDHVQSQSKSTQTIGPGHGNSELEWEAEVLRVAS